MSSSFSLATVMHRDQALACIEAGGRFHPLSALSLPGDLMAVMQDWGALFPRLQAAAAQLDPRAGLAAEERPPGGDVVLTGTPAGVGLPKRTFLKAGDRIDATIESIGTLSVQVTA